MIFTMCPVAATQRMFSGCGDRVTIVPPPRQDIPTAQIHQFMGPAADPHQSCADPQASLPELASILLSPLALPLSPPTWHLEVEVEDAHVVHEADALADLPHEHHAVHLGQVVIVIDDPLKELATLHTAQGCTVGSLWGGIPAPSHPPVELLALLRALAQLHHGGAEQSQSGMQHFGVVQP